MLKSSLSLRQHYTRIGKTTTWRPKIGYKTIEEVQKIFGNGCHVYKCEICSLLHHSSYQFDPKVKR